MQATVIALGGQTAGGPVLPFRRSSGSGDPRLPFVMLRVAGVVRPGFEPNTPVKSDMPWRSNARLQPAENDVSPWRPRIVRRKPVSADGDQFRPTAGAQLFMSVL